MQAVGFCKGQSCLLVTRFLYRHALCSKVRASLAHRNLSSGLQVAKLKAQSSHGLLHVSSQLEQVNTLHNDAGTKAVKVKLVLNKRCEFGQQFSVIGDGATLGAWNPEAAITMQWSKGHLWTAELDLPVGACVEFKVILMAKQEVLEWQPGPNRKLELSGARSSLVVSVPWSDEEDSLKIDIHDVVEKTQVSFGSLSDLAEKIEARKIESVDGIEKQKSKKEIIGNLNREMIEDYAKDFLDEQQTDANKIAAGDQGAIGTKVNTNSDLNPEEILLPLAIPESWCIEEDTERSGLSSSHDSIEPSLTSPENTTESSMSKTSNDKEEANEENFVLFNSPDGTASEQMVRPMILTTELEPKKATTTTEKDELVVPFVPADMTSSQRKQELLSDTELRRDTSENSLIQSSDNEVSIEDSSETMISATVTDNEDHTDDEDVASNEPSLTIAKVPEDEIPSTATDARRDDALRDVTERRGRQGWSKLWGAFVRGRST